MPSKSNNPLDRVLSGPEGELLTALGRTARDLAVTTLATVLQTTMEIEEAEVVLTSPKEVEGIVGDPFVVAELDLKTAAGMKVPGVLFIGQEDLSLIFNLTAVDSDEGAGLGTPVETRFKDLLTAFVEDLNRAFASDFERSVTLSVGSVHSVEAGENPMPKAFNKFGEKLFRLTYNVVMPNIMAAEVVHLSSIDFLKALVGDDQPAGTTGPGVSTAAENAFGLGDELGALGAGFDLDEEAPPAPRPRRPAPSAPERPARPAPTRSVWEDEAAETDLEQPEEDHFTPPARSRPATRARRPAEGPEPVVRPAQFSPLAAEGEGSGQANIDLIMDVSLRITVELGRTHMSVRDILALGPGSVIELDKLAGEPVDILVNDRLIAKGEVVVVDENFGVRVTDVITAEKRAQSLR